MKVGVPPDAEAEGATASPTLCLLKTRPVHVSSSSVSKATTPLCPSTAGAGSMGWGAGVAEVAARRLASRSANFFFLYLLKPIST